MRRGRAPHTLSAGVSSSRPRAPSCRSRPSYWHAHARARDDRPHAPVHIVQSRDCVPRGVLWAVVYLMISTTTSILSGVRSRVMDYTVRILRVFVLQAEYQIGPRHGNRHKRCRPANAPKLPARARVPCAAGKSLLFVLGEGSGGIEVEGDAGRPADEGHQEDVSGVPVRRKGRVQSRGWSV